MPEIGDSLGRYTLLKRLAAGGMGEVFLAAKPGPVGFGPRVALKILRQQLANDQQFIDMLVDEANISMFLNHQNVVSVLDLAEDHGSYYIAMEYVQGVTVEALLEKLLALGRRLDLSIALYIASELCRALKYAHTRVNHAGEPLNIVHRDVTPANILLSIQGEVKLTDFGIARAKGRIHQTQAGVLKGKFGYMAPEMVRYEEIDARADLFCAGVVMYLMVTGKHPAAGATVMEAIQRFEQKQIARPSQVDAEVPVSIDPLIMRALEPQPDSRWGSAAAFGAALQDLVLKNAAWRREVQDGAQRLSNLLREVSPEAFDDPIIPETAERLLRDALTREGVEVVRVEPAIPAPRAVDGALDDTSPPLHRVDSGPISEDSLERLTIGASDGVLPETGGHAVAPGRAPRQAPEASAELETEEGLPLSEVMAAQSALLRDKAREVSLKKSAGPTRKDRPSPDSGDLPRANEHGSALDEDSGGLSQAESTVALESLAAATAGGGVTFPDSSTDRNRLHDDLIDEPLHPSSDLGLPIAADDDRDARTRPSVSLFEHDTAEPSLPEVRVEAPKAAFPRFQIDDGRTLVGSYTPSADEAGVSTHPDDLSARRDAHPISGATPVASAAELLGGPSGELSLDDGQTMMGVQLPDWSDSTPDAESDAGLVVAAIGALDPDATRAYGALDVPGTGKRREDAETIIPLGNDYGAINSWEHDLNDATMLDPRARQQGRAEPARAQPHGARGLAPARESGEIDMDRIVAESVKTRGHSAIIESTIAGPMSGGRPEPRVGFDDGGPGGLGPTSEEVALSPLEAPSNPASAAAALASNASQAEPVLRKRAVPVVRETRRASMQALPADHPPDATDYEVGAKTSKWMAGEIEGDQLAWDDDAAARRAVATRNKRGMSTGVAVQSIVPASAPQSPRAPYGGSAGYPVASGLHVRPGAPGLAIGPDGRPIAVGLDGRPIASPAAGSVFERNWPIVVALVAAVVAVGVVTCMFLFTQALWPKLRLESEPPGATVLVDDVELQDRSPVTVKVAPERPHTIEFRMRGYRNERREMVDGVGRGGMWALQVSLRRILPQLDFAGTPAVVFANGKEIGRGAHVTLPELPPDMPVRLRAEAPGYRVWEQTFPRALDIPESIDIPLSRVVEPTEAPAPAPATPPRRR